jgi:uncharacterized damage-inducible protein DinB
MQPQDPTLTTFYDSWKQYQEHLNQAIAPLTAEQLALRAAPNLRTIGENVCHIIGTRVGWFHNFLGEGGDEIAPFDTWDADDAPPRSAAELLHGLDVTWQFMANARSAWSPADMQQTIARERPSGRHEFSRSWVVWHVLEHDLHHGGEVSLTLGMHGLQAPDI